MLKIYSPPPFFLFQLIEVVGQLSVRGLKSVNLYPKDWAKHKEGMLFHKF
jgi:hypothetical protein